MVPSERKVIIVEPPTNPRADREKTLEIMFEKYAVQGCYLTNSGAASMVSFGRNDGCVVDVGHGVTFITPVYNGFALKNATTRLEFGGKDLTNYLLELLNTERGCCFTAADLNLIEEIKMFHSMFFSKCHKVLTTPHRNNCTASTDVGLRSEVLLLPDGKEIVLGDIAHRCPDAIFDPPLAGVESRGIAELLYSSILQCDESIRWNMYDRILVVGRSSRFPGFCDRIGHEMKALAPACKPRIIRSMESDVSSWIGGSILSCFSSFSDIVVTKQEYEETGPSIVFKCL